VPVKVERLVQIFTQAASELVPIWELFLSRESLEAIQGASDGTGRLRLTDEAWVGIVQEAAVGYHRRRLPADTLIKSLVPLYLGKVGTFVEETRDVSPEEAEESLERLALTYEAGKGRLCDLFSAA
jgi:hypothetical protein